MKTRDFRHAVSAVILMTWCLLSFGKPPSDDSFQVLARDPTWHRLLHIETGPEQSTVQSSIRSTDFFLAPNGGANPYAELVATVDALNRPASEPMDQHAQCRFPARHQWLKKKLPDAVAVDHSAKCTQLRTWTRGGQVKSLSVVFASGFLGNPASYYGHTLLKFNFGNGNDASHLTDESLNYGALVPPKENPVVYIFSGIFGGYDGGFSHVGYYYHSHNYGDNELRDLWEYRLALQGEEVDFIVNHAWEIMGKRFQYFFLGRNCAFRMAELLELVEGVHAHPAARPWAIPQAYLQQLGRTTYQGALLISDVIYHPSRQSRFYDKLNNLSANEKTVFKQIAGGDVTWTDSAFEQLGIESRQAIADTAIDYYQFVGNPLRVAPKAINDAYQAALTKRYELPPGVRQLKTGTPVPPHQSRPPSWLQIGVANNSETGTQSTFRLRPAYYDVLDAEGGHVRNSVLSMLDLTIGANADSLWLRALDFINIESAGPSLSGLSGDNGSSWKLKASLEQLNSRRNDHLIAKLSGDVGVGHQLMDNVHVSAYVGGALQSSSHEYGVGYASASLSAILQLGAGLNSSWNYQRRHFLDAARQTDESTTVEIRKALTNNADIRMNYKLNETRELGIGVGWYW